MKKSAYNLILADDVVTEIDKLAKSLNTNRSLLINHILAEYASVMTPEKRISAIFGDISGIIGNGSDYTVVYDKFDKTLSIKSSLSFRYRPTMRYEVELSKNQDSETYGYLRLFYRTQAQELLSSLNEFFNRWMALEHLYILKLFPQNSIVYQLDNGRFTRSLAIPTQAVYSVNEIAKAISDYILCLDTILKRWLTGGYTTFTQLENDYLAYTNSNIPLI